MGALPVYIAYIDQYVHTKPAIVLVYYASVHITLDHLLQPCWRRPASYQPDIRSECEDIAR